MFFLGGFNSVVPYLLYLSLIWAFLLIGLSGKISSIWPSKIIQHEELQAGVQPGNQSSLLIDDLSHDDHQSFPEGNVDAPVFFPLTCKAALLPITDISPLCFARMQVLHFRGPPRCHYS